MNVTRFHRIEAYLWLSGIKHGVPRIMYVLDFNGVQTGAVLSPEFEWLVQLNKNSIYNFT